MWLLWSADLASFPFQHDGKKISARIPLAQFSSMYALSGRKWR
jgi:hypothetical protein